jgi:hypothetical protein
MLPQIRLQPWYPGQMGVPGSDVPRGLRERSAGIVLYVDGGHPNASATADGTDPENPITTITAAMAKLVAFHAEASINAENSVIVIAPGTYTENVAVAGSGYPDFCTILGGGNGKYPVIWTCAAGDCLSIDKYGWLIDGIHFQPSTTGAGVKLTRVTGFGAEGTVIQNCFFNGLWGQGLYGVEFDGAPANVTIQNCRFAEFDAASPAITVTATGTSDPYQTHILGCTFQECAEYITSVVGGWNASVIMNNVFAEATGDLAATTTYINLGNGSLGYNIVTQNILSGDYSNTGGYTAEVGALDNWVGNYAFDVAEAEVGDNGISIAVPAA